MNASLFVRLSVPRFNEKRCHSSGKIYGKPRMTSGGPDSFFTLPMRIADFVPQRAKTLNHASATSQNTLERFF
jgi:hypothetical protein